MPACNAKVLTAYESQRRLARNFLEGSRKKRVSFTPRGLYEAWIDLSAAQQVYVTTLVGLVVSVRRSPHNVETSANVRSSCQLLYFSLDLVDFMKLSVFLENLLVILRVEGEANGL